MLNCSKAGLQPDDRPVVIVNGFFWIRYRSKPTGSQREIKMDQVCVFFCLLRSIITWVVFIAAVENKCWENLSLLVSAGKAVEFWSALFVTIAVLLKTLHSVCCSGVKLCAVKAQEYAGFSFKLSGMWQAENETVQIFSRVTLGLSYCHTVGVNSA